MMIKTPASLTSKLYLAAGVLFVLLLVLAWGLHEGAQRYQYRLQRSLLARDVVEGYLGIAGLTFRKLNAMGEIVASGQVPNVEERFLNAQALQEALRRVREDILVEIAFVADEDKHEDEDLIHLGDIENLVGEIIQGSVRIRGAVAAGRGLEAERELSHLRSAAVTGELNRILGLALAEEYREVGAADRAANKLADYMVTVLPIILAMALLIGVATAIGFARSITRSVTELQAAAGAFAAGDFQYRVPALSEAEFSRLGATLNDMAGEITEKRVLETVVEERTRELEMSNSRLGELDRSRRRFLSDISHELRSPLTVIRGESEMALRGSDKPVPEYKEAFERVLSQADHTSRLVDDLLFVARAEEGHARLDMRSVALVGLLRAVCDGFSGTVTEKHLTITQSYSDEQVVVLGDSGRLRQVFAILLNNAVRYSKAHGEIQVVLSQVIGNVEIRIKDNGIGLTEAEAMQAFTRFYRGDNAERYAAGTGLGLPVAKAIVEAHDGEVELTGKPDQGAEALVRLPIEDKVRAVA